MGKAISSCPVQAKPAPLTLDLPVFGAAGRYVKVGTKSGTTNVLATVTGIFTTNDLLTIDANGNIIDSGFNISDLPSSGSFPFLVTCYREGKPTAAEIVLDFIPALPCTFPAALTGSTARVPTNPAATAVYSFRKNGTEFGTASISTGGALTWASGSGATFNGTSDYLQIVAPAAQDSTLAGVGICLKGTHT